MFLPHHTEIDFYLRYARALKQARLIANARHVVGRIEKRVQEFEKPYERARGWISVGEIKAELGDREGAQAAFAEVDPLIKKMPLYDKAGFLGDLWVQQNKWGDPKASETFQKILVAIETLAAVLRPEAYEILALKATVAGELFLARQIINRIPPGYRNHSLSDLGAKWAQLAEVDPQYLTFATTTFQEARAELEKIRELRGKVYFSYSMIRLITRLIDAGEHFQEEASSLIAEYHSFIRNKIPHDFFSLAELARQMIRAKKFAEAKAVIRKELDRDNAGSGLITQLAIALAKERRLAEAIALLEEEPHYSRFVGLLWLAAELSGGGSQERRMAEEVAQAAQKIILEEFDSLALTVRHGFTFLAKKYAEQGDVEKALQTFEEALRVLRKEGYGHPAHEEKSANFRLERAAALAFRPLAGDPAPLFQSLEEAASSGDRREMGRLAALLGYREDGLQWILERLSTLPEETRGWVEAWTYYGASFLPRDGRSREEIVDALKKILRNAYQSTDPLMEKTFLIAAQALRQVDLRSLQATLMEEAQNRSLDPSDRILSLTLSWLARHGSPAAQALVIQALSHPHLPSEWKPRMERALKRGGHQKKETSKVLN
jgi:tetratricopeptide (TPR) repeat protein